VALVSALCALSACGNENQPAGATATHATTEVPPAAAAPSSRLAALTELGLSVDWPTPVTAGRLSPTSVATGPAEAPLVVRLGTADDPATPEASAAVQAAFVAEFTNTVEVDGLNRLVLLAGLDAREVEVLRAYSRYLRQIGFPFSQQYIEATLARHAAIGAQLVGRPFAEARLLSVAHQLSKDIAWDRLANMKRAQAFKVEKR
jgi:hypothetical protein